MQHNLTVDELKSIMVCVLDMDETLRGMLKRGLNRQETQPYSWVCEALESENIRLECEMMDRAKREYFSDLIASFLAVLQCGESLDAKQAATASLAARFAFNKSRCRQYAPVA